MYNDGVVQAVTFALSTDECLVCCSLETIIARVLVARLLVILIVTAVIVSLEEMNFRPPSVTSDQSASCNLQALTNHVKNVHLLLFFRNFIIVFVRWLPGCGLHIEQAMRGIPMEQRCQCAHCPVHGCTSENPKKGCVVQ